MEDGDPKEKNSGSTFSPSLLLGPIKEVDKGEGRKRTDRGSPERRKPTTNDWECEWGVSKRYGSETK